MSTSWDSYFLEMSPRDDDEEKQYEYDEDKQYEYDEEKHYEDEEDKTGQARNRHYEMDGNVKREVGYQMNR